MAFALRSKLPLCSGGLLARRRWQSSAAATVPSYEVPEVLIHGDAQAKLEHFKATAPRQITLGDLARWRPPLAPEELVQLGEYARVELLHRIALRVKAHHALPYIVGTNPYIGRIYSLYDNAYHRLAAVKPVRTTEDNLAFASVLIDLVKEHTDNIPTLAQGFRECKRFLSDQQVTSFLDRAIKSRISIRLIAEQHISLSTGSRIDSDKPVDSFSETAMIGIVDTQCSPRKMVEACASFVANLCESTYGRSPQLLVDGEVEATFAYVPQHLEYIMTELLKNAFRATAERHARAREMPPVTVTIASSPLNGTATIRIRDVGGGVPPDALARVFTYAYTSVNKGADEEEDAGPYGAQADSGSGPAALDNFVGMAQTGLATIAGYGYGLPLSRIYAQFFGGSLELVSLHPHGCDVFCTLGSVTAQPAAISEE